MKIRRASTLLLFAAAAGTGARAQEFTFSLDSPATLGGTTFATNQTVAHSGGAYALSFDGNASGLEEAATIDALVLLPGGDFLFSTDMPFTPAATTFMPRDVVRAQVGAGTYALVVDGASLGLEESADIDALGFDAVGRLTVSFAAPETVGSVTYAPNDVALIDGGALVPLITGDAIGIPSDANVTGYERAGDGSDLFRFEMPVELGSASVGTADIARLAAGSWSVFFHDAAFPEETAGRDFSLPCAGPPYTGLLRAGKLGASTKLSWSTGGGARFDLVRGALETLRSTGGNFTAALDAIAPPSDVCMADDQALTDLTDTRPDPTPGRGYFYVLRAVAGCGAGGSYDEGGSQVGVRDAEIAAAAADCP